MYIIFKYSMLKKYNLFLGSLFLVLFFSAFIIHKQDPKRKVKIIVIDPGHGGKDPGCSGHIHNEKAVALAVGLKLGKYIEDNIKDVKVIFTRKTDVFVDLEDRAKIANENNADLFISIHCNAAGKPVMIKDKKTGKMHPKTYKNKKGKYVVVETTNPIPYGSETYVMGLKNEEGKMKVAQRENSVILLEDNYESKYQGFDPDSQESYIIMSNYTSAYVIQSAGLAIKIQEEYSKKASRVDKGVHRQSIWVLWRTAMPSVLTEIGYLTNPQEEKFLGSEKGQDYMAACLFRAFRKYKNEVEGTKLTYNDDLENQKPLEKEVYVDSKDTSSVAVEEEEPEKPKVDVKTTLNKPIENKDVVIKKEKELKAKAIADSIARAKAIQINNNNIEKESKLKKYRQLIVLADLNYRRKNYTDAKSFYNQAINLKVNEDKYPLARIVSVDSIIAKQNSIIEVKENVESEKVIVSNPSNSKVLFKVQFASHDKEVDSKLKYANVNDVWFYKMGAVYKYTSGNFKSFDEAIKQQTKLKELGYKDCFVAAFKNDVRMDINEAKKIADSK
jgi:N-acetylmuramoyl-L-alanine amidase